ncbi:MAG: hypothetical protein O2816_15200 [Planctomycetota bacterium]|nr:hypothetical protein [Planctomycetota bacterium]
MTTRSYAFEVNDHVELFGGFLGTEAPTIDTRTEGLGSTVGTDERACPAAGGVLGVDPDTRNPAYFRKRDAARAAQ